MPHPSKSQKECVLTAALIALALVMLLLAGWVLAVIESSGGYHQ
jgi:hypothetical protein